MRIVSWSAPKRTGGNAVSNGFMVSLLPSPAW
jgi:hypothetical protein